MFNPEKFEPKKLEEIKEAELEEITPCTEDVKEENSFKESAGKDPDYSYFESYRKPEIRNSWVNFCVDISKRYLKEYFNKDRTPEELEELKKIDGTFSFSGSILRGTAHPVSDIDIPIYIDSSLSKDGFDIKKEVKLERLLRSGESHPSGLDLSTYIDSEIINNPKYQTFRKFKEDEKEEKAIDTDNRLDTQAIDIERDIIQPIKNREVGSFDGKFVPELLTTPPFFVTETNPGSLIRLQRKVVSALSELYKKDKKAAEKLMVSYNKLLKSSLAYTEKKYPEWDKHSIKVYIKKNSEIPEDKIERAIDLLKNIRKNQELPSIPELTVAYGIT